MTRQEDFTAEQSLCILLNVHTRIDGLITVTDEPHAENCIRVAAAFLRNACQSSIPVRLISNGTIEGGTVSTPEATGPEQEHSVLQTLSHMQLKVLEPFESFLRRFGGAVGSTDIVIVTGCITSGMISFALQKRQLGVSVRLVLVDCALTVDDMGCDILFWDCGKKGGIAI